MTTKYDLDKSSRAVVAIRGKNGLVLWAAGQINDEMLADGPDADALGLLEQAPQVGIWVWEGKFKETADFFGTYTVPQGSYRKPTEAEWSFIRRGENPWKDGLWLKPTLLTMC